MAIKWKKGIPKKPGIYLRKNPAARQVVRQDIVLLDGDLCTFGASISMIRLKTWIEAKSFWWYGPIPEAPEK